eukprot:2312179-Rhodomonas_salina.2
MPIRELSTAHSMPMREPYVSSVPHIPCPYASSTAYSMPHTRAHYRTSAAPYAPAYVMSVPDTA